MSAGRKITLSERIAAVERAHGVFTGAERASTRASERDYLADCLAAARASLRFLAENEEDLRAYIACRRAARERGAGAADAPAPAPAASAPTTPEKAKCEFPLARRAAMRCAEGAYQKFLGVETAEAAAEALRRRCEVESRKDFDRDAAARERWRALEAEFAAWLRCAGEAEGGEA